MNINHDINDVMSYFNKFGETDIEYLNSHFDRWVSTKRFALSDNEDRNLRILDIGAHWLHNAYLYAVDGHELICADAPDTLQIESVRKLADTLNMMLLPTRRLERGEGFDILEDNSIDLILFCEIIEHLTFNPIPLWKEIYRILSPGGRIIITTPNSFYFRRFNDNYKDMVLGRRVGISISEIMDIGTYGHHWKEFSLEELIDYFTRLSPDFSCNRWEVIEKPEDMTASIDGVASDLPFHCYPRAHNIYLEVRLDRKEAGVVISPPWIPA